MVVRGLDLPCFVVTKRPEIALRYVPPVLLPEVDSVTVVRGLRFACDRVTNRPDDALREREPDDLPLAKCITSFPAS
jgi:hypothetical protein